MTTTNLIFNKKLFIAAAFLLMLFVSACSSNGNSGDSGNNQNKIPIITKDTLVSYIRHYGKLNVCKRTLRQEIIINDTSKIKKVLGDAYPLWLDKYTNRILKVPYDVFVEIGFDLNEIAFSIKDNGSEQFTASKPTPIVDITGIYIRFDQEYRDIGKVRWDITNEEFTSAWHSANVPELIKFEIARRKDEFIDAVVSEAVSSILNLVRNHYQDIDFKFESAEKNPTFNEIPNPIIEKK